MIAASDAHAASIEAAMQSDIPRICPDIPRICPSSMHQIWQWNGQAQLGAYLTAETGTNSDYSCAAGAAMIMEGADDAHEAREEADMNSDKPRNHSDKPRNHSDKTRICS